MENALLLACQNREKEKIPALLGQEIDLDDRDALGNTALHYLCMSGNCEMVEILIVAGGTVEVSNNRQVTPLHVAAANGTILLVKLLLEKGADIDAQDQEGKTPLIYAISGGQAGVAEYLISAGADKYSRTANGLSPMDFAKAANMDSLIPFFNSLFPWIDKNGNNSLHHAVFQNKATAVKSALSADKSGIDIRNNDGLTPLLLSVSRLNFDISDILLQSGANPNISRRENGYAPLHIAAENGVIWLGEILLEYGADVNAQTREGSTPLALAIRGQHREFAALLLRHGAALAIADQRGKSAQDYAQEWGSVELVETLDGQKKQKSKRNL